MASRRAVKRALRATREAMDNAVAQALEDAHGALEVYAEGLGWRRCSRAVAAGSARSRRPVRFL